MEFKLEVNESWDDKEIYEYCKNNSGHFRNWSYDLTSKKVKKELFKWIDELSENKRSKFDVIKHLMSKMSSLMIGKWDNDFRQGNPPTHWIGTEQVFIAREKENKAVMYGQCWCFAEIMTSLCRILNIPARTVSGKNVLIDENLDNGIDFKEDLKKSDNNNLILISKDFLKQKLSNLINGNDDKGELWEELKIYDCGDTYWTVHYWNEVYIDGEWYCFDATPINDEFKGIGPYSIIRDNGFDSEKILSMFNSPFRLWSTETIIESDKTINIPYVYSIVYPHSKRLSKYIKAIKVENLFDKKLKIITRHPDYPNTDNFVITDNYVLSFSKLMNLYFKNVPLNGIYYIQSVYLDIVGNVLHVDRITCSISEMNDDKVHVIPGTYIISYLLIENIEINPKWFTFLKYI
jgi:hypothetical protein